MQKNSRQILEVMNNQIYTFQCQKIPRNIKLDEFKDF